MMHRQANHAVGHLMCLRQILFGGTRQSPIDAELANQRIEIPSSQNAVLFHLEIQLIARHPVFLSIDEDGEVGVVVADAGHVVKEGDTFHIPERFPVSDGHLMPGFDGRVHLLEVQQAVGRADFVHLAVDAGADDLDLVGETEVFQIVDPFLRLLRWY